MKYIFKVLFIVLMMVIVSCGSESEKIQDKSIITIITPEVTDLYYVETESEIIRIVPLWWSEYKDSGGDIPCGCTDPNAVNYNPSAKDNCDPINCEYLAVPGPNE